MSIPVLAKERVILDLCIAAPFSHLSYGGDFAAQMQNKYGARHALAIRYLREDSLICAQAFMWGNGTYWSCPAFNSGAGWLVVKAGMRAADPYAIPIEVCDAVANHFGQPWNRDPF